MFLLFTAIDLMHASEKTGSKTGTMNILRYIINNHTRYQFELESCNTLPVFQAFTNCYFGPSLNWIGKLDQSSS